MQIGEHTSRPKVELAQGRHVFLQVGGEREEGGVGEAKGQRGTAYSIMTGKTRALYRRKKTSWFPGPALLRNHMILLALFKTFYVCVFQNFVSLPSCSSSPSPLQCSIPSKI